MSRGVNITFNKVWLEPVMKWQLWALPTMLSLLLVVISQYDHLTFHTLIELFAIIVSFVMFALAWSTYDYSKNLVLIFLACGYVWVGTLDLLHVITFKGMGMFIQDGGDSSVQFWISARYFEATLLLTAPLLATREVNKNALTLIFGLIAFSLTAAILTGYFPSAFIDGIGLTAFKVYSEYVIILMLLSALVSLFYWGYTISYEEKVLIALSIIMTICAEISFTLYIDIYAISTIVGHTFKFFSFWLIFNAVILSNLKAPYAALHKSKEKLSLALVEAERANQAKSEFLASMSHDFRTPLNAIVGFSHMMTLKAFGPLGDDHYEEYANDIHDSGLLLVSLINDILDLAKIESGKYDLTESELDIEALVELSLRQLSHMAGASKLILNTKISPDMPPLKGDERVMIQLFNNLISNAIKFTPEGGEVKINADLNGHNNIVISIADSGVGISSHEITRALKPFEQANSSHARQHQGTGLGLYLCKNFMDLFGGTLDITSNVGKGTTVTLTFPAIRTMAA